MVGNTYPYTALDWEADIRLAQAHGFDAFALNVGREDWQRERVADCYAAAHELRTGFQLFLSFDMTSIPGAAEADAGLLRAYMALFGRHPSQLVYRGRALVSTFAGDGCMFGRTSPSDAWAFVRTQLETVCPIHLVPAFFMDPARYPSLAAIDGIFHWNGGWPVHLHAGSAREEVEYPALDSDRHHTRHLDGRIYMAAVSPWFFTHYGPDSWNKNWIYRGDDWLLVRRWEYLLAHRDSVDIAQVISWNDYGESHYLAPVHGAQPNSQAWVDGFPHDPWLALNAYFARAFKEGRMPAVGHDRLFLWARPHPKDVVAPDSVPRPRDWELTEDRFWVAVFACAPCTVLLVSGDEHSRRFECPAGVSKLSCPLRPGHGMRAEMMRGGVMVARCHPVEYRFEAEPEVYNFNVYVAASE
ncbi:glycoside hydrolase family 71 protein [Gloeopeniophorella convolvens]|nr:glycoside hydrolase family 71 protein [Gloeopeniophorella convolvens]